MNILHIFASKTWGGGEKYILEISKKLIENNHNVYFISKKSKIIADKVLNVDKLDFINFRGLFDICSAIKLRTLIKKNDINIIHVHNFKDALVVMYAIFLYSKRKNIKFIMTRHLIKKGKTNFLYNLLYKKLDKIIFVSKLALDEFKSTSPNINDNKLVVIHNSILELEPTKSIKINYRKKYNISIDKSILLYIGRLDKTKGVDVLINAISFLKNTNYHLLIAGIGNEYEQLVNIVNKNNIKDKVTFTGFIENTEELIEQIDIGIVPSVWQEPFGLVLLEYMRASKAIITTDNGAQKEFLNDNTAVFVPPNNAKILANKIDDLLTNKEYRLKLGKNAKIDFNSKLNYNIFFNKIINIYTEKY